jgi:hypothetical protein
LRGVIAYAATKTALGSGSFGQNLVNDLPSAFANLVSEELQNYETPQDNGTGQQQTAPDADYSQWLPASSPQVQAIMKKGGY